MSKWKCVKTIGSIKEGEFISNSTKSSFINNLTNNVIKDFPDNFVLIEDEEQLKIVENKNTEIMSLIGKTVEFWIPSNRASTKLKGTILDKYLDYHTTSCGAVSISKYLVQTEEGLEKVLPENILKIL